MPRQLASSPLAPPPHDSVAAGEFFRHFRLTPQSSPSVQSGLDAARIIATAGPVSHRGDDRLSALTTVASAFSTLPYENLTRIIRYHDDRLNACRHPADVIADHVSYGAGGTCFSLTAAFLHIVRWLGFEADPILADRRYGQNTHSAVLVMIDGQPHLLDPGYLINRPLPLEQLAADGQARVATDFNELRLAADGPDRVALSTRQAGQETYRLTFKTQPADEASFLDAWRVAFDSPILHKPVLAKVIGGQHHFLNARRLQVRGFAASTKRQLSDADLYAEIVSGFGLHPNIVRQALEILRLQGDLPRASGSDGVIADG